LHLLFAVGRLCKQEFTLEGRWPDAPFIARDISKRLMNYGYHPPSAKTLSSFLGGYVSQRAW
jgi:glycine cleavage system protein P-like pyridoxal-binding family